MVATSPVPAVAVRPRPARGDRSGGSSCSTPAHARALRGVGRALGVRRSRSCCRRPVMANRVGVVERPSARARPAARGGSSAGCSPPGSRVSRLGAARSRSADVRRCYCVDVARRSSAMRSVGRGSRPAREVEGFLEGLERIGVEGLPSARTLGGPGHTPSWRRWTERCGRPGVEHLRWVDDVVLSGGDTAAALSVFRTAPATIGLRPNEAKTRIVAGRPRSRGRPAISGDR